MVTEWPPIGKIAAHSAYEMFSWYKYLIVSLVFSHLGFWSGSLFLIEHFPDLCLLVLFFKSYMLLQYFLISHWGLLQTLQSAFMSLLSHHNTSQVLINLTVFLS